MSFVWSRGTFGLQYGMKGGIWTWPGNLDLVLCLIADSLTETQPVPPVWLHPLTLENCVDDPVSLLLPVVRLFIGA